MSRLWFVLGAALAHALVAPSRGADPSVPLLGRRESLARATAAAAAALSPAAGSCTQQLTFTETRSGLRYAEIAAGSGETVGSASRVTFHVVGRLVGKQGWVFENSQNEDEPYRLRMGAGEMIDGLEEGLLGMRVGGSRRLIGRHISSGCSRRSPHSHQLQD